MSSTNNSRRDFIKTATLGAAGVALSSQAISYARIQGANDRVRVGLSASPTVCRIALVPSFMQHAKELNFDFVACPDIGAVAAMKALSISVN